MANYTEKMEKIMAKTTRRTKKKEWRKGNREILKGITWPKPLAAVRYTVLCGAASAVIALLIYFYQYGINELVARFI